MGPQKLGKWSGWLLFCLGSIFVPWEIAAQTPAGKVSPVPITIVEVEGKVEVSRAGAASWDPGYTNQVLQVGDRLRTHARSRAVLRWSDASTKRIGEISEFQVQAPPAPSDDPGFNLLKGVIYFFHRGKPTDVRVKTRTASAAVRGTEFNLEVLDDGRTILTMFDGEVELSNEAGSVVLTNAEQGVATPGQAPTKTALIVAQLIDAIQWCLYYPAVLDLNELSLTAAELQALAPSVEAYRSGDLLQAVALYPAGRLPVSAADKVFLGAILLSVGRVDQAEALLGPVASDARERVPAALAQALRRVIAAVKGRPMASEPLLATEWLAESYARQATADLEGALTAARMAVQADPNFSFGWARIAELEFSFGNISDALEALNTSLRLAPRNAEALSLKGFLLGAQNKIRQAVDYFDRAIAVDGALGNAWLGRGLCRIRQGRAAEGRLDLQTAVTLEPHRALLRSYLGKVYGDGGEKGKATNELSIARRIDPKDPTAWLYSALLNQQYNRINEAIEDLEKSQELNDNRRIYRSKLLLDQDRAVRSASLANVYRDAGLFDVSVREAARAVNYDYANYSAHLFLADSYSELRDPNLINLRYETPAEAEYLLANLLAPAGAGVLSAAISQQEYSRSLESDGFGLVSSTEYLSRGAWTESGAQYGTFGGTAYSLEAWYRTDPGQRRNNDLEQRQISLVVKQQLTPQDNLFAQVIEAKLAGGDLVQNYYQTNAHPDLRTKERQEPILNLGYQHEWSPGVHTLLLASRLKDNYSLKNSTQPALVVFRPAGDITGVNGIALREIYDGDVEIYSGELQQIWRQSAHNIIVGGRIQSGRFHNSNLQTDPLAIPEVFPPPPEPAAMQDAATTFNRLALYAYHHWQVVDSLQLIGGLTYDRLTFPENFRIAPLSKKEETVEEFLPKAGVIWTPGKSTTVRFAYARSLAGASLDQSFQLEPSQVAGFIQSYRSIIPESVAGANAGALHETYGVSFEQKFGAGTYLGVSGEMLNSEVKRTVGTFLVLPFEQDFAIPSGTREHLDYREQSLLFSFNQLVGEDWSFGARYRLSKAELEDRFVDILSDADPGVTYDGFAPKRQLEGILHRIDLSALYNHPSGIFGAFEALWYGQSNNGYDSELPGDSVWQLNAFAGYRFHRRKAEVTLGLLNISGQDYHQNPLNLYNELPRERTLAVRLRLNF